MQSPDEQQAFFKEQWPSLLEAARTSPEAAAAFVATFEDPLKRRVLYFFSRPGLVFEDWDGKSLDTIVGVARKGIAEFLAQAETAEDDGSRSRLMDLANVMSYNLATDLADCWPADGLVRTKAHFQAGLTAADDCVRWRDELGKDADARSMAWWAKGMHELSLGEAKAAEASWRRSLELAKEGADSEAAFGVVLGQGYVGLAAWAGGDPDGKVTWEAACDVFREQLKDEALAEDAKVGLEQLEVVRERYVPDA